MPYKDHLQKRKKTKARSKLISGLFKLSEHQVGLNQLYPEVIDLRNDEGAFVCTLKTHSQLLNGSGCPCCSGNHKIFSIQRSAPVTYGKYPCCPPNIRLLSHPPPTPTPHLINDLVGI